jgi:hypothetical protein
VPSAANQSGHGCTPHHSAAAGHEATGTRPSTRSLTSPARPVGAPAVVSPQADRPDGRNGGTLSGIDLLNGRNAEI